MICSGSAADGVAAELLASEVLFAENRAAAARCRGVHALVEHHERQLEARLQEMGPGEPDWSRLDPIDHTCQSLVATTGVTYSRASDVVGLSVDVHAWAPAVLDAMESGLLCERIAMLLCSRIRDVDPSLSHEVQAAVVEDYLKRLHRGERPNRRTISRHADNVVAKIDPEGEAERRRDAAFGRGVRFRREDRGMCTMTARLPAAAGAVLAERIDAFAGKAAPGDRRTLAQRRADALVAMATGDHVVVDPDGGYRGTSAAGSADPTPASARGSDAARGEGNGARTGEAAGSGAGDGAPAAAAAEAGQRGADGADDPVHAPVNVSPLLRPRVTVIANGVGAPQLEFARTGEAALETLTRLLESARGATFELVDTRPGTHDGGESAYRYRIPPDLARRVRMRDGTCRHPGCAVPAESCDIDHIVPFNHSDPSSGGLTIEKNLMCMCRRHHRYKTFSDAHYEYLDGGRIKIRFGRHVLTTTPTGPLARARGFVTAPVSPRPNRPPGRSPGASSEDGPERSRRRGDHDHDPPPF
ncbi:HNH endonuclease signature motif containing protein [Dietzia cercidiphylli]|uniref:HNH endonuclease signature motif containing protein n=1 Tax=Dietzia cercidiphylli TaxID=498199 RepID=UPI00223B5862|nr:HNH endonuclease signature motif containing protein [Dietzia cercidiphylli]MCT1516140.1 HNH endonuclease [Dietzia cercidiphylli]